MKCHGCSSSMLLERQETAGRVITQWHRCPVCNKVHMHSECLQLDARAMDRHEAHESNSDKGTVAYSLRQGIEYA